MLLTIFPFARQSVIALVAPLKIYGTGLGARGNPQRLSWYFLTVVGNYLQTQKMRKRMFFAVFAYMVLLVTLIIFIPPGALVLIFWSVVTVPLVYTDWWVSRVPQGYCTVLRDTAGVLSVLEEGTHLHPFKYAMHYDIPKFPDMICSENTRYISKFPQTLKSDSLIMHWNKVRHRLTLKITMSVTGPEQLDYPQAISCIYKYLSKNFIIQAGIEELLKLIDLHEINKDLQECALMINRIAISKIKPLSDAYVVAFDGPIPTGNTTDKNSIA